MAAFAAVNDAILGLRDRLDRIEANLRQVCAHLGLPYDDGTIEVPPEVHQLVAEGKRVHAVKHLVDNAGMTLQDAKRLVDSL